MRTIVCIGASTGGLDAIIRLVRGIPADLPAAIFLVRHISANGEGLLPTILRQHSALPIHEAKDGEPIQPGRISIAPADHHMVLARDRVVLTSGPKENWVRPAIDPLFRTAAQHHGPRSIGIILSGKLDDGTAGLWALKRRGGFAVVQEPGDAFAPEMPRHALAAVDVDAIADAEEIGIMLSSWCAGTSQFTPNEVVAEAVDLENALLWSANGQEQTILNQVGFPPGIVCPECGGQLWQMKQGPLRFRCHVGHAMSAQTLRAQQDSTVEKTGWQFIRSLEEKATLLEQMLAQNPPADESTRISAELTQLRDRVEKIRPWVEITSVNELSPPLDAAG